MCMHMCTQYVHVHVHVACACHVHVMYVCMCMHVVHVVHVRVRVHVHVDGCANMCSAAIATQHYLIVHLRSYSYSYSYTALAESRAPDRWPLSSHLACASVATQCGGRKRVLNTGGQSNADRDAHPFGMSSLQCQIQPIFCGNALLLLRRRWRRRRRRWWWQGRRRRRRRRRRR